jgi:hypothetical protein
MKLFSNLPGKLRILFSVLRIVTVITAAIWLQVLLFGPWLAHRLQGDSHLMVSVGEVSFQTAGAPPTGEISISDKPVAGAIALQSDAARPGAVALHSLRAGLQLDLASNDPALTSAVRRLLLPSVVIFAAISWLLFSALLKVCANIEGGEVFTEQNFRLLRGVGIVLMVSSLVSVLNGVWNAHVIGSYFGAHVTLTGMFSGLHVAGGSTYLLPGFMSGNGSLVIGALVLVVAEAFRQGLHLKTENDLTV